MARNSRCPGYCCALLLSVYGVVANAELDHAVKSATDSAGSIAQSGKALFDVYRKLSEAQSLWDHIRKLEEERTELEDKVFERLPENLSEEEAIIASEKAINEDPGIRKVNQEIEDAQKKIEDLRAEVEEATGQAGLLFAGWDENMRENGKKRRKFDREILAQDRIVGSHTNLPPTSPINRSLSDGFRGPNKVPAFEIFRQIQELTKKVQGEKE